MSSSLVPAPRLTAPVVVREALGTYRRRFRRVAGCALALLVPLAALDTVAVFAADRALDDLGRLPQWLFLFGFLTAALSALGAVFYSGLVDRAVATDRLGHPEHTVGEVVRTLPYRRLIAADLLLVAVTAAGLALLVVPGVAAFTFFCLVGPLVVSEGLGVRAAFRRSATLVRGHFWLAFSLVSVPLVVEHELIAAVEHMDLEREYLIVLGLHAVLAVGLVAAVALVQVTLAYELAKQGPPADRNAAS